MASTYSTSLRLELMATGDQSGTWGDTTNTNLGTLLEQAITGVLSVAEGDATLTLTALNGASDQSRNMVVELTGAMTGAQNVVVPTAEKLYLIKNSTTGGFAVTVKTSAGTGVTVPATTARWVYCDGTNVVDGQSGPWAPSANDAQALGLSATAWSDLFLASGGVINWNAGNFTLTHSAGLLTANGTIASTAASVGYVAFQAISTEAAAAAGPIIELYRNSASPAASDVLGQLLFNGEDSAGNTQEYGSIQAVIADPTSTSEDGSLDFYAPVAGTRTKIISLGPNLALATNMTYTGTVTTVLADTSDGSDTKALYLGGGGEISGGRGAYLVLYGNDHATEAGDVAITAGSAGSVLITGATAVAGVINAASATATPANGSTAARLLFGTTAGFGIYYGSGAPTVSAAQGSLYLRSDGSSTSTRMYVNTNGSTTWTNLTTAA